MTDFKPDAAQQEAIEKMADWFHNGDSQFFRLGGAAGTGKTTIARLALEAMGLEPFRLGQFYGQLREGEPEYQPETYIAAAPTRRAATQLTKRSGGEVRGVTVHSAAYSPVLNDPDALEKLSKIENSLTGLRKKIEEGTLTEAELKKLKVEMIGFENQRDALDDPDFDFNDVMLNCTELCLIDEASMIGMTMVGDLTKAQCRFLLVGDPFQLQPVQDTPQFFPRDLDALLTENHRQEDGTSILDLATDCRNYHPLLHGRYDGAILRHTKMGGDFALRNADRLVNEGFLVVDTNNRRRAMNRRIRELYGRTSVIPLSGDLITVNKNGQGLSNGEVVRLIEAEFSDVTNTVRVTKWERMDEPGQIEDRVIHIFVRKFYLDAKEPNYPRARLNELEKMDEGPPIPADFGYAITCHSAQGSERKAVAAIGDWCGGLGQRRQWIYTALTRAQARAALFIPEMGDGQS